MDIVSKLYSAASKNWMYPKGPKFPRPFRKILLDSGYITPGQMIPLKIKKLSCRNPVQAFYKIYKRMPNKKEMSYLKRLGCESLRRNNKND